MADLSQTPADVAIKAASPTVRTVQCAESVTQGQPLYLDSVTSKYRVANAAGTSAQAVVVGISLTPAESDEWSQLMTAGTIDLGATLVVGETYYLSNASGKVMPSADVSSGEYVTELGIATAADKLVLGIQVSGVERA